MKQTITNIKNKIKQGIKRLHSHPPYIRIPLGIVFVIIGAANIINPFINGVFIILIGSSLIGASVYKEYKKKHTSKLPTKQTDKKIGSNLKYHSQQSKRK